MLACRLVRVYSLWALRSMHGPTSQTGCVYVVCCVQANATLKSVQAINDSLSSVQRVIDTDIDAPAISTQLQVQGTHTHIHTHTHK